jgi:hypothetical protein
VAKKQSKVAVSQNPELAVGPSPAEESSKKPGPWREVLPGVKAVEVPGGVLLDDGHGMILLPNCKIGRDGDAPKLAPN